MIRRVYRWWHCRYSRHETVSIAKYGRVCVRCCLPVQWDGHRYVLRSPLTVHPVVGRP